MVRAVGIEPTYPCGRGILSPVRLPVPPRSQSKGRAGATQPGDHRHPPMRCKPIHRPFQLWSRVHRSSPSSCDSPASRRAATGGAPTVGRGRSDARRQSTRPLRAPCVRPVTHFRQRRGRPAAAARCERRPRRAGPRFHESRHPDRGSWNRTLATAVRVESRRLGLGASLDGPLRSRPGWSRRGSGIRLRGRLARPRPPCTAARKKRWSRHPCGHTTPSHNFCFLPGIARQVNT